MSTSDEAREPRRVDDPTTMHVRRAVAGDIDHLAWVVDRFTPLLVATARYRLGPALRRLTDAEDVVQDVWGVALPRIAELESRDGRITPTVLGFLSSILFNRVRDLAKRQLRREGDVTPSTSPRPLEDLSADLTGVVTRATRIEETSVVVERLERLPEADRALIVMRGVEQARYRDIAAVLGTDPKVLSVRYGRLVASLRAELRAGAFDELAAD